MPEWDSDTGSLEYQAQSPDENALVSAARYSSTDSKLDIAEGHNFVVWSGLFRFG